MSLEIRDQILKKLNALPYNAQRQVLDFVQALSLSALKGVPGKRMLAFAGLIPKEDLQAMAAAIDDGCEGVDHSEW
jgi:hypothetical protein